MPHVPFLCRAFLASTLWLTATALVQAQEQVPAASDDGPPRVLQIERIEGRASVRRAGRTIALQSGYLIFKEERLLLAAESRASLLLARYGRLEFQPESGPGTLTVQKLPFSSWAVDLETALRVDKGALRVRWKRPQQDDDWPLAILLGRWRAQLGSGEFLFRSAERRAEVCSVSGSLEVFDESAAWRGAVAPGQCVTLREGEPAETSPLVRANWALFAESAPSPTESIAPVEAPRAPLSAALEPPPAEPIAPLVAEPSVSPASAPSPAEAASTPPPVAEAVSEPSVAPTGPAGKPLSSPGAVLSARLPPRFAASAFTPVVPEPPTAPSGPEWIVNVMTVTDPKMAEEHLQRLTTAGYPAMLRAEQVRGRASYRVIIPGLSSDQAANRMVELLKKNLGYVGAWSLQKR